MTFHLRRALWTEAVEEIYSSGWVDVNDGYNDDGNENENFRALQGGVGRDWDDEPLIQVLVTRKKRIFIWK